jgi:uncharacterized membrane protein YgdD (TMEM256/DUF423 family)
MSGAGFLAAGAWAAALAVAAGAFGAHGLADRLDARSLELWETATRYLVYGALGTAAAGLALGGARGGILALAGWCLLAGSGIFSGTVAALALGGPRWLGAVTPLGGLLLVAGFVLLGWGALRTGLR